MRPGELRSMMWSAERVPRNTEHFTHQKKTNSDIKTASSKILLVK